MRQQTIYVIQMAIPSEHDEEFERWNAEEHLAERLACPGFVGVQRFRLESDAARGSRPADPGTNRHLTIYELEHPGVLSSPEYLAATATPTEWTRRMAGIMTVELREVYTRLVPD